VNPPTCTHPLICASYVLLLICFLVVEESVELLDSETCYLPVLSEPSSTSSSPRVHHKDHGQKPAVVKPRRIVANFASQHPNTVVHPTKSLSPPTPRAVCRQLRSPVECTLCLESADVADTSCVADASSSSTVGLHFVYDEKCELDRQPCAVAEANVAHSPCIADTLSGSVVKLRPLTDDATHQSSRQSSGDDKICIAALPSHFTSDQNCCRDGTTNLFSLGRISTDFIFFAFLYQFRNAL